MYCSLQLLWVALWANAELLPSLAVCVNERVTVGSWSLERCRDSCVSKARPTLWLEHAGTALGGLLVPRPIHRDKELLWATAQDRALTCLTLRCLPHCSALRLLALSALDRAKWRKIAQVGARQRKTAQDRTLTPHASVLIGLVRGAVCTGASHVIIVL